MHVLPQVTNFPAGLQLFQRIAVVAEAEGHHPDLHLQDWNNVYAQLSTHAAGNAEHHQLQEAKAADHY